MVYFGVTICSLTIKTLIHNRAGMAVKGGSEHEKGDEFSYFFDGFIVFRMFSFIQ